jgi:2-amino-4-hydroxy-6-hydroxymethyldihydropteridine diphosphokinase
VSALVEAYLALGSNLGDRIGYLQKAIRALHAHEQIQVLALSPVYETQAVGYVDQPDFLNLVVRLKTSLPPRSLLHVCMRIEKENGRTRDIQWGPRTLDLDILLYGSEMIDEPELIIPHPRMCERAFVMVPLCDLVPTLVHPVCGKTVRELLQDVPGKEGVFPCTMIRWHEESAPFGNSRE